MVKKSIRISCPLRSGRPGQKVVGWDGWRPKGERGVNSPVPVAVAKE